MPVGERQRPGFHCQIRFATGVGVADLRVSREGGRIAVVAVVRVTRAVVVVVVVVVVCPPLFPHALVKAPIAISAEPVARTTRRRLILPLNTIHVLCVNCCGARREARWVPAAP